MVRGKTLEIREKRLEMRVLLKSPRLLRRHPSLRLADLLSLACTPPSLATVKKGVILVFVRDSICSTEEGLLRITSPSATRRPSVARMHRHILCLMFRLCSTYPLNKRSLLWIAMPPIATQSAPSVTS